MESFAVASGAKNVYDACSINGTEDCGKTITREIAGFGAGWYFGASTAMFIVIGIFGVSVAPAIALTTAFTGAVAGGFVAGTLGATGGKALADVVYEYVIDPVLEVFE